MIELYIIAITLHFIFDWVLQPRDVAKAKKKNIEALIIHLIFNILPFSIIMMFIMTEFFGFDGGVAIKIMSINFISHFLIDWILPAGKNERRMINWTAIDQILHINILILILSI